MNREAMVEAWLNKLDAFDDAYEAAELAMLRELADDGCDCGTCAYCDDSDPGCER